MKIVCYSDLHLEFKHDWGLPPDLDADVLILAGDIITFNDLSPLKRLLGSWHKPVLSVAGNHEYYTSKPMSAHRDVLRSWLAAELPHVTFLENAHITIGGVNFFGGTMWTDFQDGYAAAMHYAAMHMNDFRYIREKATFTPEDSIGHHRAFVAALEAWFVSDCSGPRVVITHHAPVTNPKSRHLSSPLQPAFVAYNVLPLIKKYAPAAWIYGHTHECDTQLVHTTRIISNQLGYPEHHGQYECSGSFDDYGCLFTLP